MKTFLLLVPGIALTFSAALDAGGLVKVCTNYGCKKANAPSTIDMLKALAPAGVSVEPSGCHGQCGKGPNVCTLPSGGQYLGVYKPSTASSIFQAEYGEGCSPLVVKAWKKKMYGDQALGIGKLEMAIGMYREAAAMDAFQDRPWALSSLMLANAEAVYRQSKMTSAPSERAELLQAAEAAAQAAVDAQQGNSAAWSRLADFMVEQGRPKEAVVLLEKLLQLLESEARSARGGGGGALVFGVQDKLERIRGLCVEDT